MPRIVDADPNDRHDRDRNININERVSRGSPVAEILKAIPLFIWAAPLWILAGIICLAIGHDGIVGFTNTVLSWLGWVPVIVGVFSVAKALMWGHDAYHKIRTSASNRQLLEHNVRKVEKSVENVELKNALLAADVKVKNRMPDILVQLAYDGVPFRYDAKGTLEVLGQAGNRRIIEMANQGQQQQIGPGGQMALSAPAGALPEAVRYEDVEDQIPPGHALMGVSSDSVETAAFEKLMTMWICGGSNSGKSNTVGIKIEEAIENGRNLGILCIDYHANKKDSLYNKIKQYEDLFLMPVARDEASAMKILQYFLKEFQRRLKLPEEEQEQLSDMLLVVDEVPAVIEDEEIAPLLKKIARLCGRESRGFGMFGWFISQNAVGLAWLRNVALTVIAHKMVMLNDAKLACNQHDDIARDMENWPIGRVVVYGICFKGIKVLQMPFLSRNARISRVVESNGDSPEEVTLVDAVDVTPKGGIEGSVAPIPALSGDLRLVYDAYQQLIGLSERASSRAVGELTGFQKDKANGLLNQLAAMGYIPPRNKAV
jgi:hypothetical protein